MKFEDTFRGRKSTVRCYLSLYKKHIEPYLKSDLELSDIENLIDIWEANDLAPRSIQTLLILTNKYSEWKYNKQFDLKNLNRRVIRKTQETELMVLNKDQASLLMKAALELKPEFYPILLCGLHAGLRRGEVFGLHKSDINILKNNIAVRRSLDGPTKSGKTRYIPMSSELNKIMLNRLGLTSPDGILFKQIDPNPVLRYLCKEIYLPFTISFHDLRHTFATIALESGVSPKKVQLWLGHSSLSTTYNIYWNVLMEDEVNLNFLPGE